jgi:hypothetical protein
MLKSLLIVGGLLSVNCMADDGNDGARVFVAQLIGSSVGQHVAGVPSGGAPWKIAVGEAVVVSNGKIEVVIRGLLITGGGAGNNTVGPVTMVDASLVCGDVVAATTKAVPLSTAGNAQIADTITVPSPCIAPALLIRVAATTTGPVTGGPFIAVNALTNNPSSQGQDQGDDRQ